MTAHFFDINSVIQSHAEVWIVSKSEPNKPILKVSQSDFNLIKKGIFKKHEQQIKINGQSYWIDEQTMNKLKIRCKNLKVNINNLHFSMQEFMNPELISNINFKIWNEHFIHLRNSQDDIYIICSKNNKRNYESLIDKLEEDMRNIGIQIKDYYFISETFYNRDQDDISHKKCRLILQHIVGLKTDIDKFTEEEITKYDKIIFYDDEIESIDLINNSNTLLKFLYGNSEKNVQSNIKEILKSYPVVETNLVTFNKVNIFVKKEIKIELDKIFKTFESFSLFYQNLYLTSRS
jgi:hypothetical protein